jgi:hypothetical protein
MSKSLTLRQAKAGFALGERKGGGFTHALVFLGFFIQGAVVYTRSTSYIFMGYEWLSLCIQAEYASSRKSASSVFGIGGF